MARSNLAYLDSAADKAVEDQIRNPAPHVDFKTVPRTRVAGIVCYENDPVAARKIALENYREDASALKRKLAEAGVSYLAVMPTTAWLAISKNAGLYQFQPDDSGAVLADGSIVTAAAKRANDAFAWRPLTALLAGTALGGIAGYMGVSAMIHLDMFWGGVAAMLGAGFGGLLFSAPVDMLYFSEGKSRPRAVAQKERSLIKALLPTSRKKLFQALWPQGREIDGGVRLKIDLPPAPHETQENLLRAKTAGLSLVVDAVQEAVQFPVDVSTALADTRQAHWAGREQEFTGEVAEVKAKRVADRKARSAAFWEALANDPIVTTRFGSATAVIAQYGDFPIEQKIIDKVLGSTQLI
jgi:hypothetical protein